MIEVNPLLLTLLAEAAGLLSIIIIVWVIITLRRKKRDKAAAIKLVASIKSQSKQRLEHITQFISQAGGIDEADIKSKAKNIDRQEKAFFKALITLYLKRDENTLASMDTELAKVINAYKTCLVDETATQKNSSNIDDSPNEALTISNNIIGKMLVEFNHVFEKAQPQKLLESASHEPNEKPTLEPIEALEQKPVIPHADDTDSVYFDEKTLGQDDLDDVFFEAAPVATTDTKADTNNDDFGSVVSPDDVDDLFDSIDLSKEIEPKQ